MFDVSVKAQVGEIDVMTSNEGGLSNEQVAEIATKKIISVSNGAPPAIKEQALVFQNIVRKVIFDHLLLARKEERATICQQIRKAGHNDLAEYIRRL
jgi:hypothetical protein